MLEMPEDDNMSIILGRPFLNTAGAVINCNQGKVTFNVNDKEYMIYFPKKIDRKNALNSFKHVETIKVGQIICSEQKPKEEYQIVMVGTIPIEVEEHKHLVKCKVSPHTKLVWDQDLINLVNKVILYE
jgi:hypothetical protein